MKKSIIQILKRFFKKKPTEAELLEEAKRVFGFDVADVLKEALHKAIKKENSKPINYEVRKWS